jgi:hypothetical protein
MRRYYKASWIIELFQLTMLVKRYFPSHFFMDGQEHVCAAIIGLPLVYHETLVAIKPSAANDAVNYLGKATIELRNWTRREGRATEAPAKLRLCSRPNSPAKWDSRDAICVGNHKPSTLSLGIMF